MTRTDLRNKFKDKFKNNWCDKHGSPLVEYAFYLEDMLMAKQAMIDGLPLTDRETIGLHKFRIGQKVLVCGTLRTVILRIEGDKYWFLDEDGKECYEVDDAIEAI